VHLGLWCCGSFFHPDKAGSKWVQKVVQRVRTHHFFFVVILAVKGVMFYIVPVLLFTPFRYSNIMSTETPTKKRTPHPKGTSPPDVDKKSKVSNHDDEDGYVYCSL
jgi:hypothetical protein